MKIPAETTIIILAYFMQRNPQFFPDPEKFIPERFLPEESSKRNPFAMVAFSAGPRNCIGKINTHFDQNNFHWILKGIHIKISIFFIFGLWNIQ
jgi:hypothetical protein